MPKPTLTLPPRIGNLNVVEIVGTFTHLKCDAGHYTTRQTRKLAYIVRNGLSARCTECPKPVTEVQMELLAVIRQNEGTTLAKLDRLLLKSTSGIVQGLAARECIDVIAGKIYTTPTGRELLEKESTNVHPERDPSDDP